MGDKSAIEWTDATWNPVTGCDKVSAGCKNCYAERTAARMKAMGVPGYENGFKVALHPDRVSIPLRWKKPRRIFVNSMSDLFHDEVPDAFIDQVFAVMILAHWHTFQVLTKRTRRMADYCASDETTARVERAVRDMMHLASRATQVTRRSYSQPEPGFRALNVWLGTSVENQASADERVPHLLRCPAAVRFLSCEPLLGPVKLQEKWFRRSRTMHVSLDIQGAILNRHFAGFTDGNGRELTRGEAERALLDRLSRGEKFLPMGECEGFSHETGCPGHPEARVDWIIAGGESGPNARPMHPDWARSLRDQCVAAGVPFLFKQWGEWCPQTQTANLTERAAANALYIDADGSTRDAAWGSRRGSVTIQRVGKKAAGRTLDGRTWDEFPTRAAKAVAL